MNTINTKIKKKKKHKIAIQDKSYDLFAQPPRSRQALKFCYEGEYIYKHI